MSIRAIATRRNALALLVALALPLQATAAQAQGAKKVNQTAVITMENGGEIKLEFFPEDAPKTGFSVSYAAKDEADANRVFDALSKGGAVTMPVSPTSWSPAFGMCTDRFGVSWMVGVNPME